MLMRGYDGDGHLVKEMRALDLSVEQILDLIFENASVSEVHIRNIDARCFIAKAMRET